MTMTKHKHTFQFTRAELLGMDLSDPGACTACGEYCTGVEPDAERYECEACGKPGVYGAQQLMMMGLAFEHDDGN